MTSLLNWGMLDTGRIAHKFAQQLPNSQIGAFAFIGPQSINELKDALPALDLHLSLEELRWLHREG